MLYEWLWGPIVRMLSTEGGARLLRWLHPMRMKHYLISSYDPFLVAVAPLVAYIREHRNVVPENNLFTDLERSVSKVISSALNFFRDMRDSAVEQAVKWAFGPIGFGAIFPPEPPLETSTATIAEQRAKAELAQLKDQFEEGGLAEAVARMLVAVIKAKGAIRRRSLMIVGELNRHVRDLPTLSETDFHKVLAKQALLMELDSEAALAALPHLLPSPAQRSRAVEIVSRIMQLEPKDCDYTWPLAKKLAKCLELGPDWHKVPARSRIPARLS